MTDPRDYQSLLYAKLILSGTLTALNQANPLSGGELVSDLPE